MASSSKPIPSEPPAPPGDVEPFRLRTYQQEMLEASVQGNVIVAMDTGSGKTHVAISRIQYELERSSTDKLVWFTTPSVALSRQQYEVLNENLPAYLTKLLTGQEGVDAWSDQRTWDAVLTNVRVVVGTPKVLEDALVHGFVKMSRIALMVFDEAHRCMGDSPMNVIMKSFYHPSKRQAELVPHILGLTASPVISAKSTTLSEIEANLDAVAITPRVYRSDLERHVNTPLLTSVIYSTPLDALSPGLPRVCRALEIVFITYDLSRDPYVIELRSIADEKSERLLDELAKKPKTYCYRQLKRLLNCAKSVHEALGSSAAEWYTLQCIDRFLKNRTAESLIAPDVTEKERSHLAGLLEAVVVDADPPLPSDIPPIVSDKVHSLVNVLRKQDVHNDRAIIFAEQRAVVSALAHVLRRLRVRKVGTFVGSSSHTSRSAAVADLVDLRGQQKDLEDFRCGDKSLMVATSVLEEGIDVSACSLVVCFDPPQNLVSFVQRRGRARQQNSKYVVFLSAEDAAADPSKWQQLECEMKKAYMESRPPLPPIQEESQDDIDTKAYQIPSTNAKLTLRDAKAHLYHFCEVSSNHVRRYVDVRPEFETQMDAGCLKWTACVTLPSFVHPSVRTASSSRAYVTEGAAIKDAAFQAYVALHRAKLLTDNLLPIASPTSPEDDKSKQHHQPRLIKTSPPITAWERAFQGKKDENVEWLAHRLTVSLLEAITVDLELYLPASLVQPLSFELFYDRKTTYTVLIQVSDKATLLGSESQLEAMRHFTYAVLSSVHSHYMAGPENMRFAFLLSDGGHDIYHYRHLRGTEPANSITNIMSTHPRGLINFKRYQYRKYLLLNNLPGSPSDGDGHLQLKAVPRRKTFIHPVQATNGDTVQSSKPASIVAPASDCSVDRLPANLALLAAFIPSILHHVDLALTSQDLQREVLGDVRFNDSSILVEATAAPSASEGFDYNRLEYLGDAVLKFYTVRQVLGHRLNWPEGYLAQEEHHLVSNRTLTQAAQRLQLDRYIRNEAFTGEKWRPPYVDEISKEPKAFRELSSKVLADVVEALIGAAFAEGGFENAFDCLRTLLPEDEWYSHAEPMSRLLGEVQHIDCEGVTAPLEHLIGHRFHRPALLLEAITHASFQDSRMGLSYECLEFLGDAVLDIIVVPKLFAHQRKLREVEMTRIRAALVNGNFLGYCCMAFEADEERFDAVTDVRGGKPTVRLQDSVRKIHLYDFLRCGAPMPQDRRTAVKDFEQARDVIDDAMSRGRCFPWPELLALNPPKFFSDLVESIIGAIYLDTKGDLAACETFVEKLGIIKVMRRILDDDIEPAYPKEQLGLVAIGARVNYTTGPTTTEDGRTSFGCDVAVDDLHVASVAGYASKNEAEVRGARKAIETIQRQGGMGSFKKRKLGVAGIDEEAPVEESLSND